MKKTYLLTATVLISSFSFAQHSVIMKNGDKMDGLVTSLNNGIIEIQKNQTISKINLSEISEIIFDTKSDKESSEIGEKTMTARSEEHTSELQSPDPSRMPSSA